MTYIPGYRWGVPSLSAIFAGKARDLPLAYVKKKKKQQHNSTFIVEEENEKKAEEDEKPTHKLPRTNENCILVTATKLLPLSFASPPPHQV
jgi:hypothetical protein